MLRSGLRSEKQDLEKLKDVMDSLNSVDVKSLKSPSLRAEVLCYSYYFGLLEASQRGYSPIIKFLCKSIHTLCAKHDISFGVSVSQLKFVEASHFETKDPAHAAELIAEVLESKDTSAKIKAAATALQKTIASAPAAVVDLFRCSDPINPTGSMLPTGNPKTFPCVSIMSGKPILSGLATVCEDGKSHMREGEFFMWTEVTPFSPLHSGHRAVADSAFFPCNDIVD